MERFDKIMCRIKRRPEYGGRSAKPCTDHLEGKELLMEVMWDMDETDLYPGEWALGPISDEDRQSFWMGGEGITWIASGDVEIIGQPCD